MTDKQSSDDTVRSPQADYDDLRNVTPEMPCPYLPGLMSRAEAYQVEQLHPSTHEHLLTLGFRRSGHVIYRPRCHHCSACKAIRVPVDRFAVTRSLRRVALCNSDVELHVSNPVATDEKHALFRRYLDDQHDGTMSRAHDAFVEFLYGSPTDSVEFDYRIGDRLVAVGIADECPSGLSSVYLFFDPDERRRSLGTLSVLREIEYCRAQGLPYYYLGFWIVGSQTMDYKARFRPNEILAADGCWVPFRE